MGSKPSKKERKELQEMKRQGLTPVKKGKQ